MKVKLPKTAVGALVGLTITVFYFCFNFSHLTKYIDRNGDSNTYAWYITETMQSTLSQVGKDRIIFNPHHLAFDWLGQQFVKHLYPKVKPNQYRSRTMFALRIRNLTVASVTLGLVAFLITLAVGSLTWAVIFPLLIGFSKGYWVYAQMNDTPLIHCAFALLVAIVALFTPRTKFGLLTQLLTFSALHYLAVMFHQSNMILGIPVMAYLLWSALAGEGFFQRTADSLATLNRRLLDFLARGVIYSGVFFILVGSSYYYIGAAKLDLDMQTPQPGKKYESFHLIKNAKNFYYWIFLYSNIPSRTDKKETAWGNGFKMAPNKLAAASATGLSEAFIHPYGTHPLSLSDKTNDGFNAAQYAADHSAPGFIHDTTHVELGSLGRDIWVQLALLFCGFGLLLGLGSLLVPDEKKSRPNLSINELYSTPNGFSKASVVYGFVWVLIYSAFAMWWEPDYYEFWLNPMLALLFCAMVGWGRFEALLGRFVGWQAEISFKLLRAGTLLSAAIILALINWSRFLTYFSDNSILWPLW